MRKYRKLIIPVLIIFLVGGCAVGPDFVKPDYQAEEHFRFDSTLVDSTQILSWWDLFGDPILDTMIMTALRNNRDVRVAAARVQQAWAAVGYYRADMWPKIDLQAGAMRGNFLNGNEIPTGNSFFGAAQLTWELDFWGKYRRATEAAKADMLATEFGMRAVQIALISAVAVNYFQLLDFRQRIKISEKTLLARDSSLQIIEARFDEGIIPELDVNQAEIQKAIAAASVPFHTRQAAFAENALSILLGQNPGPILDEQILYDYTIDLEIPPGIPSLLLTRRPDIIAAEEAYRAQNARIGVAVAQRFPSISLTGALGAASSSLTSVNAGGAVWSVGAGLVSPLFHFNKNKRRVDIERFRAEEYLMQYEHAILNSFREVEDALVEISTLNEELDAREMQMRAAMNAEELADQRYDKGVTSYLEVLETQRASFEAQLFYTETYQMILSAFINLYRTLGGGWITPEEQQMAEAQEAATE